MSDATEQGGFRHAALLYAGEDEFVQKVGAFVGEGVDAGETVLVVVAAEKIDRLREHLGDAADAVRFADMGEAGRNPGRIIPLWREFVSAHAGGASGLRGVGEPIDDGRSPDALVECERHESLLNVAFDGFPSWSLVCPYDTDSLPPEVIAEALRNHPYVRNGETRPSPTYRGLDAFTAPFDDALPDPPAHATTFRVDLESLGELRDVVGREASSLGFSDREVEGFVLTVHELATNSVRHGGGTGLVRLWSTGDEIVADVRDRGRILDPLAGRVEPSLEVASGRGLWLANQLTDLVQIRTYPNGGAVRVRLRRR